MCVNYLACLTADDLFIVELAIFPQRLRNYVDLEEKDDGWKNVEDGEEGEKSIDSFSFLLFFSSLRFGCKIEKRERERNAL